MGIIDMSKGVSIIRGSLPTGNVGASSIVIVYGDSSVGGSFFFYSYIKWK